MAISANLIKREGEEIVYPNTVAENVYIGNEKYLNTFVSEMQSFKTSQDTVNSENETWKDDTDVWKTTHTHTMNQITDLDLEDLTAGSANKVEHPLVVKFNDGTVENDDQFTFDGSRNVTINITTDKVGAAAYDHTHQASSIVGLEEEIEAKIQTIAPSGHTHTTNEITGLQDELNDILEEDYYTSTVPSTVTVGGVESGYVPSGGRIKVTDLLYQILHAYVAPSVSITSSPAGGIKEWNTTQKVTGFNITYTRGSNPLDRFEIYHGSDIVTQGDITSDPGSQGSIMAQQVTLTNGIDITIESDYKNFEIRLYDDTGNYVSRTSSAFTFVYPYYFGVTTDIPTVDDIDSFTKSITAKGDKSFTYNLSQQRAVFCCAKTNGTIGTILDTNGFDATGTFTRIEMQIDGADYYVYYNNPSTNTNFNFTFKY